MYIYICIYINFKAINNVLDAKMVLKTYIYTYIYIYILWIFNKNNNNWPLQCVTWINSNLQMVTIYLVFLKPVTAY